MDDKETPRLATECLPADEDLTSPEPTDAAICDAADDQAVAEQAEQRVAAAADELRQRRALEAILFSSDTPLSAGRLAAMLEDCTPARVRKHIDALNEQYEQAGLSFRIEAIARGYQMMTLPEYEPWVAKLNRHRSETRLSGAALETLAIIAYKQPVIRADVEAIRGVACGEVISRLRDMGLVRILGRAEIVGRPLLYGTTRKFLDIFGLEDLDDLPPLEALKLRAAPEVEDSEPVSKDAAEVEPVAPPPIPQPPVEQPAAVGA